MTRYLLDTDVLIDFSKSREPALSRVRELLRSEHTLGVSPINIAEFFSGLALAGHDEWREFFDSLAFWSVSGRAAVHAGATRYLAARRGRPLPLPDTIIAAVAREHGAVVFTGNPHDFQMEGLSVLPLR